MTAQELKNSILQLAVQGKLVPQCKEDEPASELLKRICAEKDQNGIKGKKLPPITDEEIPFDIPENWVWTRLDTISSITSGGTPARTNPSFWGGNIPWVKIGDIKEKYVFSSEEKITVKGLNSSSAKVFPKNTILYTIFATIGTVGILGIEAATNQAVAGITFYGEYCLDYMYYVLVGLKDILVSKGKGMAQMNINQTILKNTPIPLPPLAEQERIVAKIEELMPLVEEYGKAEEQLTKLNAEFPDKLRKSILQQAVQGKLTERDPADEPASELIKRIKTEKEALIKSGKIKKEKLLPAITDKEKPFDIPDTWEWVRLAEISEMCLGKMLDKTKNKGVLHPYLRNVNVRWGAFDLTDILQMKFENDEEEKYSVKYGDLVVCEGGEPGRCAVWSDKDSTFRIQKALHRIRFSSCVDPFFGYRVFEYYACNGYFSKRFSGETIKHLPGAVLANIAFPLPPLAEQKRIVKRVEELLALCDELK
ncbi:restriction endonuclease subunit S [[Clostridium] leptum]|uniref:Restriction endonuclease subunit S n=1 Tax=[Clostridium] leptum TaxID=1535 RepID=A0A412AUD0_9FIRM|nr:restriction endonuclease subunit S [[Clostridium] leptum]